MIILIDVTRLVVRFREGRLPTGVDRVGLAYIRHYRSRSQAVIRWAYRSWILPKAQSEALFDWLLNPVPINRAVRIIALGMFLGWRTQRMAGALLFNTGHSGLEQTAYPAMLQKMGVRPVMLVHDLIPITHPEYCRPNEDAKHTTRMRHMLEISSGIIAISQNTLDTLTGFAQHARLALPPAIAALLAPGMAESSPGERPLKEPYFVMLSTIEPRKNHLLILQVWRRLAERMGSAAPRLVVIGQRGWECENVVDLLERCRPLKGVVFELSDCTDNELATYLHHSQALLFPSFTEGYGIPLVESLTLGVPVIASDLPVFKEIAADTPDYADPLDGKRWEELILDYLQPDSTFRTAQLTRIKTFKSPTWADHFAKVDALLEQL